MSGISPTFTYLSTDDLGQMCFNPAKLWQLQHFPHPRTVKRGWYNSTEDFFTVNASSGPQVYEMIGIGEYRLQKGKATDLS
jgi:hypothetical protein